MSIAGKTKSATAVGRLLDRRRPPLLFAVGDSHSAVLRREPGVQVVHLGPVTLHRAGRPGELVPLAARSLVGPTFAPYAARAASPIVRSIIRPDDAFMCFFGEIDVRAHFSQHRAEYGTAADEARALAERSAVAAREFSALTNTRGGFASITPPADSHDDRDYPTTASIEERREWTIMINHELARVCHDLGLAFVDFHDEYTDATGYLDKARSDGSVHVKPAYANHVVAAARGAGLMPA